MSTYGPNHTFLMAFVTTGINGRKEAEDTLTKALPRPESDATPWLECWWVAEDDRNDGSDCDSAQFVRYAKGGGSADALRRKADALLADWLAFNGDDACECAVAGENVVGLCWECAGYLDEEKV